MMREQKKGISPIIATLLLILIAIAAGVVVYAYVVGFVGNTTNQGPPVSESLAINAWTDSSGTLSIFVQNTGHNAINITQAYLLSSGGATLSENVTLGSGAAGSGYIINPGNTISVVAKGMTAASPSEYYQVKVVTSNGNSATSNLQLG
jgi:archaeal type IV pilus assembly protein PilA